ATFYDKNQLTTKTTPANGNGGSGGNNVQQKRQHQKQQQQQQQFSAHDALIASTTAAKDQTTTINRQATAAPGSAYQRPYSQVAVAYQQPQEQQPSLVAQHKQIVRVVAKNNNGIQQKEIQYVTAPPHQHNGGVAAVPAFNYERLPLQYLQQQLQQQLLERGPSHHQHQRPQQVQYIIAIPMSYLRQLQNLQQQQQHQQSHLSQQQQQNNGHQQQSIPQLHSFALQPGYSIAAGPLARDHHGTYRPVHRFSPTAINEVQQHSNSAGGQQHQAGHQASAAPASPGYITQYIQVPASALLAAAQQAQLYQRPVSAHTPAAPPPPPSPPQQVVYQHQPSQQHQPQQQQEPISQQPQYYYYPQQQLQQQHHPPQPQHQALKASPPVAQQHIAAPAAVPASPPLYAYQIQEQQPTQQHEYHQQAPPSVQYQVQHLQPEQLQQQQLNVVGKQQQQHQQPEQALYRQSHHAHGQQQESAQVVPQELVQKTLAPPPPPSLPTAPVLPEHSYEPVVHYNPQYLVQYEQPQLQQQKHHLKYQQPQLQLQHVHINPSHLNSNPQPSHTLSPQPSHRFQLHTPSPPPPSPPTAPHQHQPTAIVDNLNNLPYSQAVIQGPTPVPFTHLAPPPAALGPPTLHIAPPPAAAAMTPYYHHPLLTNSLQPAFAPLGIPSKVTSFTNVLLQPFAHGHGHGPTYQTTPEIGPVGSTLPYFNHDGGLQYSSHLYHPPTSVSAIVNKVAVPEVASPAGAAIRTSAKASSATAKASGTDGSRTI
ncbi:uncharacterized protein LOC133336188, partial [Musca vetustissima]|uniref:uncharacterized protein LOC133336188 n=1 Tax=Musca vetustissima TaxID=27455 RepID=UPI002AB75017